MSTPKKPRRPSTQAFIEAHATLSARALAAKAKAAGVEITVVGPAPGAKRGKSAQPATKRGAPKPKKKARG